MILHDTKAIASKLLEVEHPFLPQAAVAGRGRGEYQIIDGHGQIQPVVVELLKLDIVYYVAVGEKFILIAVRHPRRWNEVEGEIQHIVARHLP